jgi:TATA-binding protein-associated factor Taf7
VTINTIKRLEKTIGTVSANVANVAAQKRSDPSGASETPKRLRDNIFGPEFKKHDRLAAQRFRELDSGMQTAIKEWDQAAKDLLDARSEFEQLNRL